MGLCFSNSTLCIAINICAKCYLLSCKRQKRVAQITQILEQIAKYFSQWKNLHPIEPYQGGRHHRSKQRGNGRDKEVVKPGLFVHWQSCRAPYAPENSTNTYAKNVRLIASHWILYKNIYANSLTYSDIVYG